VHIILYYPPIDKRHRPVTQRQHKESATINPNLINRQSASALYLPLQTPIDSFIFIHLF
jgi:hypothetical protein